MVKRDGGEPAERHSHHGTGPRGKVPNRRVADVDGEALLHGPGTLPRSVGVAVSRQVEGYQGAIEGHGDGVPGVGVLSASVEEDHLGLPLSSTPGHSACGRPPTSTDALPHHRGSVEGQAVLGGVLVEQPEFVVLNPVAHTASTASRARCPSMSR